MLKKELPQKIKTNNDINKYFSFLSKNNVGNEDVVKKLNHIFLRVLNAKIELEKAIDVISDPIVVVDNDLKIVRMNKITSELLKRPAEDLIGYNCCSVLSRNNHIEEHLKEADLEGHIVSFEAEDLNIPGFYNLLVYPFILNNSRHYVLYIRNITELKEFEKALNQHRWKLQSIVDCARNGIIILRDDIITFANRTASIIAGIKQDQLSGREFVRTFLGDGIDKDALYNSLIDLDLKEDKLNEFYITNEQGESYWISLEADEIYVDDDISVLVNINDITPLKDAQMNLIQSEKLSTLGQLAAGVAHEINNPLAYIMSNLEMLEDYFYSFKSIIDLSLEIVDRYRAKEIPDDLIERFEKLTEENNIGYIIEDVPGLFKETFEGSEIIKKITTEVKSFARVDKDENETANINAILDSALNIVWNSLKYVCDVEKKFGDDLPDIYCQPQQLSQAFMNIILNAAQAIQEKIETAGVPGYKRGVIRIATYATEDKTLGIEISDDAMGMPEDVKKKVFDPFFTTKDREKGTGLGMSICLDIIHKHEGSIDLESEYGKGTDFKIFLPVS